MLSSIELYNPNKLKSYTLKKSITLRVVFKIAIKDSSSKYFL